MADIYWTATDGTSIVGYYSNTCTTNSAIATTYCAHRVADRQWLAVQRAEPANPSQFIPLGFCQLLMRAAERQQQVGTPC